jgi:hypothetical protein
MYSIFGNLVPKSCSCQRSVNFSKIIRIIKIKWAPLLRWLIKLIKADYE